MRNIQIELSHLLQEARQINSPIIRYFIYNLLNYKLFHYFIQINIGC